MAVVEVWTPAGTASDRRRRATTRPPTVECDTAVVRRAARAGSRAALRAARRVGRVEATGAGSRTATRWRRRSTRSPAGSACRSPSDVSRRTGAAPLPVRPAPAAHVGGGRRTGCCVKGAPDAVFPRCAVDRRRDRGAARRWRERGLRVLAVASRARRREHADTFSATRPRTTSSCSAWSASRTRRGQHGRGRHRRLPAGRHPGRDGHRRPPGDRRGDRRRGRPARTPTASSLEGRDLPADETRARRAARPRRHRDRAGSSPEDKLRIARALRRRAATSSP